MKKKIAPVESGKNFGVAEQFRMPDRNGIIIISGSCCFPNTVRFDDLARQVVNEVLAREGVGANVRTITATSALYGGIPKETLNRIMTGNNQSGTVSFPVILLNGEVVSYGLPEVNRLTEALRRNKERSTCTGGSR